MIKACYIAGFLFLLFFLKTPHFGEEANSET
jgi:hypothetical protein